MDNHDDRSTHYTEEEIKRLVKLFALLMQIDKREKIKQRIIQNEAKNF